MKLTLPTKIVLILAAIAFLSWSVMLAQRKQTVERLKREVREFERWRLEKHAQLEQPAPAAAQPLPTPTQQSK